MADTPAQRAAAGVLDDVAADEAVLLSAQAEDAEVFGSPAPLVAEELVPGEGTTNEATVEVEQSQDELEIPEISWEAPEELQEFLNTPDFDEDDLEEPEYVAPQQQVYEQDEYEDPEKAALQKKIAKLEKKAAWEAEQRKKASIKSWREEGRKYFQFADVDSIDANSRRAFLKQAQAQHEAVARVAKPVFDQLAELKAKAKEEALAEARADAERRWGAPTHGPGSNQPEDTQTMQRERLQQGRGLKDLLKGKLERGEVRI